MSIGMGLTFVSMTLVALHGIPTEESGIGSGVLNTMQQVGGAIGLAALSTVAVHFTRGKAAEISGSLSGGSGPAPTGDMKQRIADLVGQGAFTEDPIPEDYFGCAGVAQIDRLQDLLLYVGKNGYRHHVSATPGRYAAPVAEALEYYLNMNAALPQRVCG